MKSLFEKIFKKEVPINYIIAEYKPVKSNKLVMDVQITEYDTSTVSYDAEPSSNDDEMAIDKIYQRN